jgi:hypothetical protein
MRAGSSGPAHGGREAVRCDVHGERQKIEDDAAALTDEENGGQQGWTRSRACPFIDAHTWVQNGRTHARSCKMAGWERLAERARGGHRRGDH